ncbi:MAG: copper-binding protein [Candidatus Contendobacter sp.]|nr:copper-binding protein [Candidatus Contendobacter sp.]MDS4060096.1 copper-binding protein [Candidatus Contendobacter sp.]
MKQPLLIAATLIALLSGGPTLAADPHAGHGAAATTTVATIPATGTVKGVDAAKGKLVIDHDPIPALHWPRMAMDFQLVDKALTSTVKAGDKVKFTMTKDDKGAYVITAIEPAP